MAEKGMKWYVMRAVSGKEQKLKEYIEKEMSHNDFLRSNVNQVLLPVEKHAALRNGKRVVKEKVALPGYVFVEANLILCASCLIASVFLVVWMILHLFVNLTSTRCSVQQKILYL